MIGSQSSVPFTNAAQLRTMLRLPMAGTMASATRRLAARLAGSTCGRP
jgi:hypothetical protein